MRLKYRPGPPGIPVLKAKNSLPRFVTKFPVIPYMYLGCKLHGNGKKGIFWWATWRKDIVHVKLQFVELWVTWRPGIPVQEANPANPTLELCRYRFLSRYRFRFFKISRYRFRFSVTDSALPDTPLLHKITGVLIGKVNVAVTCLSSSFYIWCIDE